MFSRGFLSTSSHWMFGGARAARDGAQDLSDFRRLATQLHHDLPREQGGRSTVLVTPGVSNLPAYSGASLAQCLGEELRSPILLVDACLKESHLTRLAGAQEAPGLGNYLEDPGLALDALVLPTKLEDVWLLPAGTRAGSGARSGPGHGNDSTGIAALVKSAGEKFDFVVFAGGSVLHDPLALAMVPHAGCVLLMAVENQTRLEDLDLAQRSLAFCHPRKIGLLLTLPIRSDGRAT